MSEMQDQSPAAPDGVESPNPVESPDAVESADAVESRRSFGTAIIFTLIVLPWAIGAWKHSTWPGAEELSDFLTLEWAELQSHKRLDDVLTVPAAAIVVVFVRLALGLRMLGPFRPILIAIGLAG